MVLVLFGSSQIVDILLQRVGLAKKVDGVKSSGYSSWAFRLTRNFGSGNSG